MSDSWNDTPDSLEHDDELSALEQELEWRACSKSPSYFITKYAKTKNPLDPDAPYQPLPDLPYLRWFLDFLQTEPLMAVPKSRRVLVTWLVTGYDVWECLFLEARVIGIGNEDQAKARENLAMHQTVYTQLPEWMRKRVPMTWSLDLMRFPSRRSEIRAFEQDPNVFRMFTFSRIWIDEAQKQRYPSEMYLGALPTVRGRDPDKAGQLIYTGTPAQGFFELTCHDQIERPDPPPPAWERQLVTDWEPPWLKDLQPHEPVPAWGVVIRRLHDSGFLVFQVHYTADPEKRSPEWLAWAKKGIPADDWNQDYELNWKSKAGRPAIPQIRIGVGSRQHEIVVPYFRPPKHWVRFSSHDYGVTNPYSCHFHALSPEGIGYTYWEYYAIGPLGVHLDAIKAHEDFPALRLSILDRSCWAQTQQQSESLEGRAMHMTSSIEQLHRNAGVYCIPAAAPDDRVRIARVEEVWPPLPTVEMELVGDTWRKASVKPILWHMMDNCPNLRRECEGSVWEKLTYVQKLRRNDPEKLVDKDNHAFDEFIYAILHLGTPDLVTPRLLLTDGQVRDELRRQMQINDDDNAVALERDEWGGDDGLLDD